MMNPKDTLKSIKALLSSDVEETKEEVVLEATEEVVEVAEETVELEETEEVVAEEAEEEKKDEYVSVSAFEETVAMLMAEIEALKPQAEEEAPVEEAPAEEELSAEVVAEEVVEEVKEEVTELSVHNPEVQQRKRNSNKPLTRKQAIWNIINN
jgi:hypothetical protein